MAVPFSLLKGTAFYSYELYCVTSNPKAARRAFDNIPVGPVMLPADHRRYSHRQLFPPSRAARIAISTSAQDVSDALENVAGSNHLT